MRDSDRDDADFDNPNEYDKRSYSLMQLDKCKNNINM